MILQARDKELVIISFKELEKNPIEFGVKFYESFFELNPALRGMFSEDLQIHASNLFTMIGIVVESIDHLGALAPVLVELGARHADLGVQPKHYEEMNTAMLRTIREIHTTAKLDDVDGIVIGWNKVLLFVARVMQAR